MSILKENFVFEKKIQENLVNILINSDVEFAIVFGSFISNHLTPISDIDIGIYLPEILDKSQRFDIRLDLITKITVLFPNRELDLLVINDVPLGMQFNILADGKLILCQNEEKFFSIKERIVVDYLDFQPHEEYIAKLIMER